MKAFFDQITLFFTQNPKLGLLLAFTLLAVFAAVYLLVMKHRSAEKQLGTQELIRMCVLSMLAALATVSILVIHVPIFPSAKFLEYDIADVFMLLGGFLFGPAAGLAVLAVSALIQSMTVSAASGVYGLIMHLAASGALVAVASLFCHFGKRKPRALILAAVCGTLSMALVMIPMNLFITPYFMGASVAMVKDMLLPVIIPFNLIKAGANSVLAVLLFLPLKPALQKTKLL